MGLDGRIAVAVAVAVGVFVRTAVAVFFCFGVFVRTGVRVFVLVAVGVFVGTAVGVLVEVAVGLAVTVAVAVAVLAGVAVFVATMVAVAAANLVEPDVGATTGADVGRWILGRKRGFACGSLCRSVRSDGVRSVCRAALPAGALLVSKVVPRAIDDREHTTRTVPITDARSDLLRAAVTAPKTVPPAVVIVCT